MHRTSSLLTASKKRALALSVYFRQPKLGMKDYEILSRATAFLLSVDPPTASTASNGHLDKGEQGKKLQNLRQDYKYDPAGGPPRPVTELGWLEFCPTKFRPRVHCVAASHVLSPWRWPNYYTQPWLTQVQQSDCTYALEVLDNDNNNTLLAKFALSPYPIHHPDDQMDLALIHLQQEESALTHLQDLGVEILYLRDSDKKQFEKNDQVYFEGFEITEQESGAVVAGDEMASQDEKKDDDNDDERVFDSFTETGSLIFASPDRFLATTARPLPEGLCGGPVLDTDGSVCGIVEGIVPMDHEDARIAGAASFIPSPQIAAFLDHAEPLMLQQIVPKEIFDKVEELKQGKALQAQGGGGGDSQEFDMGDVVHDMVESMKQSHSMDEVNAVLGTIQREREEVIETWEKEGGDLDDIVARVRQETRQVQQRILEEGGIEEDDDFVQKK